MDFTNSWCISFSKQFGQDFMMWKLSVALALVFASFCVAAPQVQLQPNSENLDDLISSVFNVEPTTTVAPGSLADLIAQVFPKNDDNKNNNNNNLNGNKPGQGATFLGVNNQNVAKPDDCECVPYYQCQNGTILDDGIGLIDIRSGFGDTGPES